MRLSDFIPLISVLLGGLLALLGGLLTNSLVQSTNRKDETRKLLREKLEEIYLLSGELVDYINDKRADVLRLLQGQKPGEEKESPQDHLTMIVALYHPDLGELMNKVEKYADEVERGRANFYFHIATDKNGDKSLLRDIFKKEIDAPCERLEQARKELVEQIRKKMLKYIGK